MSTNIYDYTEAIAELIAKSYKWEDMGNYDLLADFAAHYFNKYYPHVKYDRKQLMDFVIGVLYGEVRGRIMERERREERERERREREEYEIYLNKAKEEIKKKVSNKTKLTETNFLKQLAFNKLKPDDAAAIWATYNEMWHEKVKRNRLEEKREKPEGVEGLKESEEPKTEILAPTPKPLPPYKPTFSDKLKAWVATHDERLTFDEFKKIVANWSENTTKSMNEWYNDYNKLMNNKPGQFVKYTKNKININNDGIAKDVKNIIHSTGFKSPTKINAILNLQYPDLVNYSDIKNNLNFPIYNFPTKENKKYYLHMAAARGTYLIDLMFTGKIVYLVAINVNTRKAYVEPTNIIATDEDDADIKVKTKDAKTTRAYLTALTNMIKDGMKVKHLRGDGEKAFNSNIAKAAYIDLKIDFKTVERLEIGTKAPFEYVNKKAKTDPMHGSLGLIDRLIRTLRDMAYNLKIGIIQPQDMKKILWNYNNAPHKFLSKMLGFDCSPEMVDDKMEEFIVQKIIKMNYNVINTNHYRLGKNEEVEVYNERDSLQKRRTITRPGTYKVIDWKNGLFHVINQDGKIEKLPRYKLNPKRK